MPPTATFRRMPYASQLAALCIYFYSSRQLRHAMAFYGAYASVPQLWRHYQCRMQKPRRMRRDAAISCCRCQQKELLRDIQHAKTAPSQICFLDIRAFLTPEIYRD